MDFIARQQGALQLARVSKKMRTGAKREDEETLGSQGPLKPWYQSETRLTLLQLSMMFGSGVTILDCLETLSKNASPVRKQVLDHIVQRLESGHRFSSSLEEHPQAFPKTVVELTRIGEETGALSLCLYRASEWLENQDRLRKRLQNVLTYPLVIISVAFLANILILKYCLPQLLDMLSGFKVSPPLFSRLVFGLGTLFTDSRFLLFSQLLLLLFLLLRHAIFTPERIKSLVALALRIPYLGPLLRTTAQARIADTLSLGLSTGLSSLKSLDLSLSTCGNPVYAATAEDLRERIEMGNGLSESFRGHPTLFSSLFCRYIELGEETGRVDETSRALAKQLEADVEYRVVLLGAVIEPLLLALCSVFVGMLVVATFLPIQQFLGRLM